MMEFLVVCSIMAIVIGLASPYLGNFLQRYRLSAAVRNFQFDLMYTRNMAIALHESLVLCPSTDNLNCTENSDWHTGRLIFIDSNRDRKKQSGETLLRVGEAMHGVVAGSSQFRHTVRFLPDGTAAGSAMTISICAENDLTLGHGLVIANNGRVRLDTPTNAGKLQHCPEQN